MIPKSIFKKYLKALSSAAAHGDATEESFYPALKQTLEEFATVTNRPYVDVTALPKPTEGGSASGTVRVRSSVISRRKSRQKWTWIGSKRPSNFNAIARPFRISS